MKKFKLMLLISFVAIFAVGIFVGCNKAGVTIDPEVTPHKITYCANGGLINGNTEAYLYVQDGVHAPEPSTRGIIKSAQREGFKFAGWAKGKVNEKGEPELREDYLNPTDGGVWMNIDGAITEEVASKDESAYHQFYEYDADSEWIFSRNTVESNLVLVAVWENSGKYIIANKEADGKWEDLSELTKPGVTVASDIYKKYDEAGRLFTLTNERRSTISRTDVTAAYSKLRPSNTAIRFYSDADCKNEILINNGKDSNHVVTDAVTVIYYKEETGKYDLVFSYSDFSDAIMFGRNAYFMNDIASSGNHVLGILTYSGTIKGDGHSITLTNVSLKQTAFKADANDPNKTNSYGAFLGDLKNAVIENLNVQMDVSFEVCINPADEVGGTGNEMDENCFVGIFAKSMTNCTIKNVNVEFTYTKKLSKVGSGEFTEDEYGNKIEIMVDNNYNVTVHVNEQYWQAVGSATDGENVFEDSSISVRADNDDNDEQPDSEQSGNEQE